MERGGIIQSKSSARFDSCKGQGDSVSLLHWNWIDRMSACDDIMRWVGKESQAIAERDFSPGEEEGQVPVVRILMQTGCIFGRVLEFLLG